MFANFEEEARQVLINAKKEMYELNHPYVSSEHLFLAILKKENSEAQILKKYKINYTIFKQEVIRLLGKGKKKSEWFIYTPLLKRVIENAIIESKSDNGLVKVKHLLSALLEEGEGVAIRILLGLNVDIDRLYDEFSSTVSSNETKLLIEEIGIDLTKLAHEGKLDGVYSRDEEIHRIIQILSRRTKNNPLLIGAAGVGKTAIVEALAQLIEENKVPLSLRNKKIINLDMSSAVAGTKYRGEFEERIQQILKEVENDDNIILFIDEIHTLVGAGGAEGAIDASNIFKPALARGKLKCIGATTIEEYKKTIEKDSALDRRFQKLVIEKPSTEKVKEILINLKPIYEKYHKVHIDNDILDLIIELTDEYIHDRNQPDKAIDILDEVSARVSLKESKNLKNYQLLNQKLTSILNAKKSSIKKRDFKSAAKYKKIEFDLMNKINNLELKLYKTKYKKVTKKDVAEVLSEKTQVPLYDLININYNSKKIEKLMSKNIIGQNEAISTLMDIINQRNAGLNNLKSIMFCGSSGVGKTQLAKIFAQNLVGKNNVIKLDMSEYKESTAINKFLGAPPGYIGYDDYNNVLEEVQNKPYSVLILDEIEKAHPSVINLFLQILDDGKIKNSKLKEISFSNTLIIMTSNEKTHNIQVGFNHNRNNLNNVFTIPFINRIDKVITFNNLTKKNIDSIFDLNIQKLKKKYQDKIKVNISFEIKNQIIKKSDYENYGARKLEKIIKTELENQIIRAILNKKSTLKINQIEKMVNM